MPGSVLAPECKGNCHLFLACVWHFFHISVQKAQLKYFVEIDTSESSGELQFSVGSFAEDRGVECLKKRKYQLALLLALNRREFSTFYWRDNMRFAYLAKEFSCSLSSLSPVSLEILRRLLLKKQENGKNNWNPAMIVMNPESSMSLINKWLITQYLPLVMVASVLLFAFLFLSFSFVWELSDFLPRSGL